MTELEFQSDRVSGDTAPLEVVDNSPTAAIGQRIETDVVVDMPGVYTVVRHIHERGDIVDLVVTSRVEPEDITVMMVYIPPGAIYAGSWQTETHGGHLNEITTQYILLN